MTKTARAPSAGERMLASSGCRAILTFCSTVLAWLLAASSQAFAQGAHPMTAPARETAIEVSVGGRGGAPAGSDANRATSRVERRDLDERLPRSAPDALRYEPGVYVQQSAHGQGSPYIRGRTGQHTVVLFDGIRMNTSTWRQGPNQYFFTIDSSSVRRIEVTRGGASTLYGSDAIAGVIDALPIAPRLELGAPGPRIRPRTIVRFASADEDFSNRFQLDVQLSEEVQLLVGGGWRRAGLLESGGVVRSPSTGRVPDVPKFQDDARTQLGTGFRQVTGDGRLVWQISAQRRLTLAAYAYRQFDSPRTDQCPAPFAPIGDCLNYDEQFRTLVYAAHEGDLGAFARVSKVAVSYQRQHERRTLDRPSAAARNYGRDDVDTLGLTIKMQSQATKLAAMSSLRLVWGADAFADRLRSSAQDEITDIGAVRVVSRGQYIDGSRYLQGGAFAEAESTWLDRVTVRLGGRGSLAAAAAQADPGSRTERVAARWGSLVGNLALALDTGWGTSLLGTYDRSFRAPNLDDLTSRQQSGPGFQFENSALEPEKADTAELGFRIRRPWMEGDLSFFRSVLHDAITRAFRRIEECPPATPQCGLSAARFQLVNADGPSVIAGAEAAARVWLPYGLVLRASVAYAYGEGPNPQPRPDDAQLGYVERVPLSRIPPLNGTLDARWAASEGLYLGAALRWAASQLRLAPTDHTDARIPDGGTPGFAVADLRAGVRLGRSLVLAGVLENATDAAYRYHGSSINGPGRGLIVSVEGGL